VEVSRGGVRKGCKVGRRENLSHMINAFFHPNIAGRIIKKERTGLYETWGILKH
jgi:hypothetical protein